MSTQANKALARRIVEEMWNTKNMKVVDEVYSPDFGGGHEAAKQFVTANLAAFPDLHNTIEDQIAENDLVVTRYVTSGTHQGDFANIPPTGNRLESQELKFIALQMAGSSSFGTSWICSVRCNN